VFVSSAVSGALQAAVVFSGTNIVSSFASLYNTLCVAGSGQTASAACHMGGGLHLV